jgi:hypothetical protein
VVAEPRHFPEICSINFIDVEQVIPRGVFVGLGRSFHEKSGLWSEAKPKRTVIAALVNWRQTTDEVFIGRFGWNWIV